MSRSKYKPNVPTCEQFLDVNEANRAFFRCDEEQTKKFVLRTYMNDVVAAAIKQHKLPPQDDDTFSLTRYGYKRKSIKKVIRIATCRSNSCIGSANVGYRLLIHTGKRFRFFTIRRGMLNHKLGEFRRTKVTGYRVHVGNRLERKRNKKIAQLKLEAKKRKNKKTKSKMQLRRERNKERAEARKKLLMSRSF